MPEEMQRYEQSPPYPTYEATAEEAAVAAERQAARNAYAAYVKAAVDRGDRPLAFGAWQRLADLEDALPETRKYQDGPSDRLPVRRG